MAVLELYGKCRELGYCDCRGFFGCVDDEAVTRPSANELEDARKAARQEYHNSRNDHAIEEDDSLVECEVCDRSHLPEHPHIANIDGDVPIDDSAESGSTGTPTTIAASERELPSWLQDAPMPAAGPVKRGGRRCAACGLQLRSNHNCKGRPKAESTVNDPRIAVELPRPVQIIQEASDSNGGGDPELDAIAAILKALDGVHGEQGARIIKYVLSRTGIDLNQ